jgi:hypothetical protein
MTTTLYSEDLDFQTISLPYIGLQVMMIVLLADISTSRPFKKELQPEKPRIRPIDYR